MSQGNTNPSCWIFGTLEPEVGKESAAVVQVTRTAVAEQALFRNGCAADGHRTFPSARPLWHTVFKQYGEDL